MVMKIRACHIINKNKIKIKQIKGRRERISKMPKLDKMLT